MSLILLNTAEPGVVLIIIDIKIHDLVEHGPPRIREFYARVSQARGINRLCYGTGSE